MTAKPSRIWRPGRQRGKERKLDETRFDQIATAFGTASNRRTLAGLTAALAAAIGVETADAKKKKRKKKKTKPPATCVPQELAVTCAGGKCGSATNNCKKRVDCGACDSYVFDTQWGGDGNAAGKLRSPRGVAVDGSGNVFVADTNNNRIQKFSNRGEFLGQWNAPPSGSSFFLPYGVAVDLQGNVFATDQANNRIVKFTSNGAFITEWSTAADEEDTVERPWAVAVDASGAVYVSEFNKRRVLTFSNAGAFTSELNAGFVSPTGVAKNNTLYVVDSFANRVYRFPGSSFGSLGSGDGELMGPSSVVLDPDGNILVTDTQNNRFQKFDRNGDFLTAVGVGGNGAGAMDTPLGIALDTAGNVFVADFGNHLIQKFRPANTAWLEPEPRRVQTARTSPRRSRGGHEPRHAS